MKKNLIKLTAAMMALFSFSSCGDDDNDDPGIIMDYTPVVFKIDLVDDAGDTLLDPDGENNVLSEDIYIQHDGQRYDVEDFFSQPSSLKSRYYPTKWDGITVGYYNFLVDSSTFASHPCLRIGEWDGGTVCDKETISFHYNGKSVQLAFSVYPEGKYNLRTRRYYIDGVDAGDLAPDGSCCLTLRW